MRSNPCIIGVKIHFDLGIIILLYHRCQFLTSMSSVCQFFFPVDSHRRTSYNRGQLNSDRMSIPDKTGQGGTESCFPALFFFFASLPSAIFRRIDTALNVLQQLVQPEDRNSCKLLDQPGKRCQIRALQHNRPGIRMLPHVAQSQFFYTFL